MDFSDAKLHTLNSVSLLITMTNIETTLKIVLLLASIGYTFQRWYYINKNKGG